MSFPLVLLLAAAAVGAAAAFPHVPSINPLIPSGAARGSEERARSPDQYLHHAGKKI